jgi:hypothetical protein
MDSVKLRHYVELEKERRDHESRLNSIKESIAQIEDDLLKDFEKDGISKATVDGLTIYIHRQLWASAKDGNYEQACEALRKCGMGEYVQERFNTNSLSAFVRESERNQESLPKDLADAITVAEKFSLRTRQS